MSSGRTGRHISGNDGALGAIFSRLTEADGNGQSAPGADVTSTCISDDGQLPDSGFQRRETMPTGPKARKLRVGKQGDWISLGEVRGQVTDQRTDTWGLWGCDENPPGVVNFAPFSLLLAFSHIS